MHTMERKSPNLFVLLLSFVGFILLAVWLGVAVGANDLLWFLPSFNAQAAHIDLYWDGQHTRLMPGDPAYNICNEAIIAEIPHVESHPPGVGLSDISLETLRQEGRLLEVHYDEPVLVHTGYHFGASRVYFIPLSGHHVQENRVFNAARGSPLELDSAHQIITAAERVAQQLGFQ